MHLILDSVSKGRDGHVLPPTSLEVRSGEITVVACETEQRPLVLSLIASGRMRPDAGRVIIDGRTGHRARRRLQERVALVDAPIVSEPEPQQKLGEYVDEEITFTGRLSTHARVADVLRAAHAEDAWGMTMGELDPATRLRVLTQLAVARPRVEFVVLTSPDRLGGDLETWWSDLTRLVDRGYAALVVVGQPAYAVLRSMPGVVEHTEGRHAVAHPEDEEIRADAPAAPGGAHYTSPWRQTLPETHGSTRVDRAQRA